MKMEHLDNNKHDMHFFAGTSTEAILGTTETTTAMELQSNRVVESVAGTYYFAINKLEHLPVMMVISCW